jgi:hypothetical protein
MELDGEVCWKSETILDVTIINIKQQWSYSLKIRGYVDLSLYSGAALTFMFIVIGLMTTPYQQAHAQTSPLTEDQDGDGDPLNEEFDIRADCYVDQELIRQFTLENSPILTDTIEWATLSEDDCNFVMQYLSGQCEEQDAKGVNVTMVCDDTLAQYLGSRNLLTKDYRYGTFQRSIS